MHYDKISIQLKYRILSVNYPSHGHLFYWLLLFFLWVYEWFLPNLICKHIYVSFEGLPETCEEGIRLEFSAFETLYGGQFEITT